MARRRTTAAAALAAIRAEEWHFAERSAVEALVLEHARAESMTPIAALSIVGVVRKKYGYRTHLEEVSEHIVRLLAFPITATQRPLDVRDLLGLFRVRDLFPAREVQRAALLDEWAAQMAVSPQNAPEGSLNAFVAGLQLLQEQQKHRSGIDPRPPFRDQTPAESEKALHAERLRRAKGEE